MDAYRFDAFDGAAGGDCQVVVARTVEPYAAAVGDAGFARDRGRSMCGGMTITNGSSCWSESGVRTRMRTVSESSANRSLQRRKRLTSRSVVVSALARVSGAGSLHDAELTSVAMAPWGTCSLRREVPRRRAPCGKPRASGVSLPDRTGWLPYGAFLRLRNPAGALPLRRILRPQYPLRSISAPRSGWARGRLRRGMFRRDRRPCDLACRSLACMDRQCGPV